MDGGTIAVHVSGLLVAPASGADPDAIEAAVAAVPGCAVERRVGARLVVVAEAPDGAAAEVARERLLGIPGVASADVVFASVDAPAGVVASGDTGGPTGVGAPAARTGESQDGGDS